MDKTIARRLASNFASSKEFKALDASDDLKGRIKETAKKYIVRVKQQRMRHAQALLSLHGQSPTKRQKVNRPKKYHVLIHVVGEAKFNEILSVYKEIKEIRKQSMIWTKFTPQFITTYNSTSTTAATTISSSSTSSLSSRSYKKKSSTKESSSYTTSSSGADHDDNDHGKKKSSTLDSEEDDEPTPVSKVLPPPISNIYFHVRLVNVMRAIDAGSCCRSCKPIEEVSTTKEEQQAMRNRCVVYQNDWDGLLHDAKKKLAVFRKFEKEKIGS